MWWVVDNDAESARLSEKVLPFHQSERVSCYPFCTATSRFVFLNHKNAPMQIKTETKEPKAVASPIGNRIAGS